VRQGVDGSPGSGNVFSALSHGAIEAVETGHWHDRYTHTHDDDKGDPYTHTHISEAALTRRTDPMTDTAGRKV
jgi:hypothetical protein